MVNINKTIIYFLLMTSILLAENEIQILFIGNSLTYYNDLPGMFEQIALNEERDIFVDESMQGGIRLRTRINDPQTIEKINERDWDYVIQQSDDITAFSDMYDDEIYCMNILKNHIKSNCDSTKIIYEILWGFENGRFVPGEGFYTCLQ